jgi:hypothetical protein
MSRPGFEQNSSRIQVRNVTAEPACSNCFTKQSLFTATIVRYINVVCSLMQSLEIVNKVVHIVTIVFYRVKVVASRVLDCCCYHYAVPEVTQNRSKWLCIRVLHQQDL